MKKVVYLYNVVDFSKFVPKNWRSKKEKLGSHFPKRNPPFPVMMW